MSAGTTLGYRTPAGQDRTVVLTALRQAGYDASPDDSDWQLIHVACAEGDREQVRDVIGSVHTTAIDAGVPMDPGTIRFTDET